MIVESMKNHNKIVSSCYLQLRNGVNSFGLCKNLIKLLKVLSNLQLLNCAKIVIIENEITIVFGLFLFLESEFSIVKKNVEFKQF